MRRATTKTVVLACVVITLAAAALLWRPLLHLRDHYFGPFDLVTQTQNFTRVAGEKGHEYSNTILSDPSLQMHPWARFAAEEMRAGRWPLWNPYNGSGAPLLANYQSALLSPFQLPYYVLRFRWALVASALLKLIAAGAFATLFLRRIGCTLGSALFGGIAYAASAVLLMLVQHPHSGVLALLPASLYAAEIFFSHLAPPERRVSLRALALLALTIGAMTVAGHPETLFYCCVALALYCLSRWLQIARATRTERRLAPQSWRAAGWLGAAAVVGLALGALQVVPFTEFLAQSHTLHADRAGGLFFAFRNWPLHVFPNLAGAPMNLDFRPQGLPWPNYQETNTFFVGALPLLCAALALVRLPRDPRVQVFAGLVALWFVYGYDVAGIGSFVNRLTPLYLIPVHRTHPLWTPSVCVLAALALDRIERRAPYATRQTAMRYLYVGAAALACALIGAVVYVRDIAERLHQEADEVARFVTPNAALVALCFVAGILAIAQIAVAQGRRARIAGYAVLLAAVVTTSAQSIADYVPTVPDRYVYPHTPNVVELQRVVGDGKFVALGAEQLQPELNVWYDLRTIGTYDVLGVAEYDRLTDHFFDLDPQTKVVRHASVRALDLFGVDNVLARGAWVPIDTDLGERLDAKWKAALYTAADYEPYRAPKMPFPALDEPQRIDVTARRDGLDAVSLQVECDKFEPTVEVGYRWIDLESQTDLANGRRMLRDLPRLPCGARELVVTFPPVADSKERDYRFELTSLTSGARFRPYRPIGVKRAHGESEPVAMLDLGYGQRDFERVGDSGPYEIYRRKSALGRAWVVGAARSAASHEEAFQIVTSDDFQPRDEVVVEEPVADSGERGSAGTAKITAEDPTRLALAVECGRDGWLVMADTFYAGWRARVDGAEVPLRRVNYAFRGLPLARGSHTVELTFAPGSVVAGLWISLAALGLCALAFFLPRRRARASEALVFVPRRRVEVESLPIGVPALRAATDLGGFDGDD